MAFPIPAHLPRRNSPKDVTSQILSKIDAATNRALNANLAAEWISELDETITSTKVKLHERIQKDLPEFQRQSAAATSVQERLQVLTTNVDTLSDAVSNQETGLIPNFIRTLITHSELAEQSADAHVKRDALVHLLACKKSIQSLDALVNEGKLSHAVRACEEVETLLQTTPTHLNETLIMADVKRKFRVVQARNDEQLSDAYMRSVVISPLEADISCHEITLHDSVHVRQSDTVIELPAILASLAPHSLSNHLTTLRRDLTSQFIEPITTQHVTTVVSSKASNHVFSLNTVTFDQEEFTSRLENLSKLFRFLSNSLFLHLPAPQSTPFTRSLCKPTTSSILNNILLPSIPSSYGHLPPFLELAKEAVIFEDKILVGLLGNDTNDRPLKAWVDGVSGHYERHRRTQLLERSREIIVALPDSSDTFLVEIDVDPLITPSVVPVQDEEEPDPSQDDAWGFDDETNSKTSETVTEEVTEKVSPVKDDAWGFDGEDEVDGTLDENGWGFDDNIPTEQEQEIDATQEIPSKPSMPSQAVNGDGESEPATSDAWGWEEGEDAPLTDESAWDDPWGDEPASLAPKLSSDAPTAPTPIKPKMATRLEKAANKGKKKQLNGSSATPSPVLSSPSPQPPQSSPPTTSSTPSLNGHQTKPSLKPHNENNEPPMSATKRPSMLDMRPSPKETYVVSGRSRLIVRLVEDILNEGKHLTSSSIFSMFNPSQSSAPLGNTLLLTAPAVLDLHRALYPVKFSKALQSPEEGMRYANDCAFLAVEVERVKKDTDALVNERFGECARCLKVLSESWFHAVIATEQKALDATLTEGSQGFTYTGDQDRYDECESAMTHVLKHVRQFASRLKGILSKTKYYTAVGMVVEAALARIICDILALPDIPEVESHRLSELCHIFNAMEGLFVEDSTQPSFVVAYVPSWLKFSYLSELLEASMADITYLFEEGALVDFEVDELVQLVRALFADTQLRVTTIGKLMGGHPISRK